MNEPTLQELGARLRQAWQGWIDPADDDYDAAWERLDAVVNALLSRLDAQPANNERALAAALAMCGDKDRKLYLYGEHQGWCKAKEIATIISRYYVVDAPRPPLDSVSLAAAREIWNDQHIDPENEVATRHMERNRKRAEPRR